MSKAEKAKNYMLVYGNAFNLESRVIESLFILAELPKWYNKPETSLRIAIKRLSEFKVEFQLQLIENAIAGNYQGLVFTNSKQEEQKFYATKKDTKFERLARIVG